MCKQHYGYKSKATKSQPTKQVSYKHSQINTVQIAHQIPESKNNNKMELKQSIPTIGYIQIC